jgi:hypothetical protein
MVASSFSACFFNVFTSSANSTSVTFYDRMKWSVEFLREGISINKELCVKVTAEFLHRYKYNKGLKSRQYFPWTMYLSINGSQQFLNPNVAKVQRVSNL